MSKNSLQDKLIVLLGFILLPILLYVPFIFYSIFDYNYTGVIQESFLFSLVWIICVIISFYVLFYLNRPYHYTKRKWNITLCILALLTILTVCIPYDKENAVLLNLHLLCGVIDLIVILIVVLKMIYTDQKILYVCMGFLCIEVFLIATSMSITGIVEWLFGTMLSIILTILHKKRIAY